MKDISFKQWSKFIIISLLYIIWVIWVGNYWWLIGELFIIDIYLTKKIPFGFWKKSKNKFFRETMGFIDAFVFAVIAVFYFINIFFFQNYQIPSSSLEKTLLTGDFLLVSKIHYGPKMPNTPLSFPFVQHTIPVLNTKSYIEHPQWEYKRLKGFGEVKRNDIVVFNFPAGDTVATNLQNADYYTLCAIEGYNKVNNDKATFGEIIYRPVDRRENYVKRCTGLPGDNLEIKDRIIYINGIRQETPKHIQFNYYVETSRPFSEKEFRDLGIAREDRKTAPGAFRLFYRLPLTQEAVEKLGKYNFITAINIEPPHEESGCFPLGHRPEWNRDNYGPVWIPSKGSTITLNRDNLPIYERIIRNYEKNDLKIKGDKIYINGEKADSYTFRMDYYWMMGDNRHNSADSRAWGFVPEDHIVGKPLFVFLSLDKDRGWFDGKIRFNRLFRPVTWLSEH